MVDTIDYQYIIKHATKLGKEAKVRERAIQLQRQLKEGDTEVPYRDAYEMAYHEIVIDSRHIYF
jgi:hypothetical protein